VSAAGVHPARAPAAHRLLAAGGVRQQQRRTRQVIGMEQRRETASEDRVRRESEDALHGAVRERECLVEVELPDPVLGRLDDIAQAARIAPDLLLRRDPGAVVGRLVERAHHGARQAAEAVLQHVIGGAPLQRIDGAVLAERAGDEDERQLCVVLADDFQRLESAETRQREIRQHDVRAESLQCLAQPDLGIHPARVEHGAGAPQRTRHQLGVDLLVFDQQYPDCLAHGASAISG
jgi:hypothetical protein